MPAPVNPAPQKRVTVVRTQTPTNTVVRSSLLLMTVAATVSAGVLLAALVIQSLPKRVFEVQKVAAVTSPAGYEGNVLLVKFADAKLTDKQRIAAVNAALKKPVQCTRTETVRVRQGLRRVSKQVDVGYNCTVKVQRMTAVVPAKEAGAVLAASRAKKVDAAATKTAYTTLQQYSIVTLTGTRVNIPSAIAVLKAAGMAAEANSALGVAGMPADPRVASALRTLGVADAQANAYGVQGDANGDAKLTWADPEMVVAYIFNGGAAPTNRIGADMNADGLINISDVVQMVQSVVISMPAPNDLTSDAKVNMDDAHFLQRYIFSSGAAPVPLASADYSANGVVNVSDLVGYILYVQTHPITPVTACTRGDANADGKVDLADATAISDYIFQGAILAGIACADINGNGTVNISDAVALVSLLQNPVASTGTNVKVASLPGDESQQNGTPTDGDPGYLLGDVDASNRVNIDDVTALLNYIFQGAAAPTPLGRADMNSNGVVNISDGVALTKIVSAAEMNRCAAADLNSDGVVDAKDPTVIMDYIYSGGSIPDLAKADINGNGAVNISDAVALVNCIQLTALPEASLNKVNTNGAGTEYLLGDVNNSGTRNLDDAQYIIDYIFNNGPAPVPMEAGDIDANGIVNISDVVALVHLLDILANNPVDLPVLYGDANKDGAVDSKDIEVLTTALIAKQSDAQLDVNRDGKANILDAYYLPQLLDVDNASKPLPDVNGDGKVNMGDVDYLLAYIFAGGPAPANMVAADVNGDGKVNISDVVAMTNALTQQGALQYITGDANRDGQVTMADAKYLIAYIFDGGPAPDPLLRGDVSGDGSVNVTDVVILVKRFSQVAVVGNPETSVAVLDTGVKTSGAVLKAAAMTTKDIPGNKKDDDRNGYVDDAYGWNTLVAGGTTVDANGHGTMVATAILQVAPKAQILPVAVLDRSGMGTCLSVARGLIYATQQGADVANISASGKGTCTLLSDVVTYAQQRGTVTVMAAGNDSAKSSTTVQGKVAAGLVVGALDGTAVAKYSNTGATLVAPGVSTASQGTSLSAAYTSGCSALVLTKQASLTPVKVLERLTTTAKSAALRCDLATNF